MGNLNSNLYCAISVQLSVLLPSFKRTMKAFQIIGPAASSLVILVVIVWTILDTETFTKSSKKWQSCDSTLIWDFTSKIQNMIDYRVKNIYAPSGTFYHNADAVFIWDYKTGGYIIFACQKPSGITCDVFKVEVATDGTFSAGWNVLSKAQMNESLKYTFGVDNEDNLFYMCDPKKRFLARFELTSDGNSYDSNQTVCSAEYGNRFNGSARECDYKFLSRVLEKGEHVLHEKYFDDTTFISIMNKLKLWYRHPSQMKGGFNKRILLIPVAIVGMVGIVLVAKKVAQCIIRDPRVQPSQK